MNEDNWIDRGARLLIATIIGILLLWTMGFFSSCTRTVYVPKTSIQRDSIYITQYKRDSIYMRDSIFQFLKADTMYIEKWHTKYVEREVHDTLYQAVHDSIPQPYPVIKEVPAELTWWQHFRISLANILLWVVGIVAVVTLVRWWLKQKKVI